MTRMEHYDDCKRRRICVDCYAGLTEDDGARVRCVECRERIARSDRARAERGERRRRPALSESARVARDERRRRRREERKVSGRCVQDSCDAKALDESVYCDRHRTMHLEANRRYEARKREKRTESVSACLVHSSTEMEMVR